MNIQEEALLFHEQLKGKIDIKGKAPVTNAKELSLAYTPGVAEPCRYIAKNKDDVYKYTGKGNMVAVVTDGSAVLGLGDIGPEAGMPVMEGKCALFKSFGDVDAFPLCVKTKDVDEFVNAVYLMSGSFGGINLEDISAPRCFEIERKLKEKCDIPIFHDDQHGTAVITLAGLQNALKVVGKKKEEVKIVTSGAGAAAIAIVKLLLSAGFKNITMCDRKGAIYEGREGLNWIKAEMALQTNLEKKAGTLADVLVGADVFIGVSAPGMVTKEMVATMNKDAIIFACANPTPEIY
ncbi:MAG: NAD-dependent malic enzyme, partial [Firmicutes bacterium]|nr:NAD-dependent malic enzyme [Bacillota bacterium]